MDQKKTENMALWNSVHITDPRFTKKITGKSYQGTAIDPQWQIMKATEIFGPFGQGWGTDDENYRFERINADVLMVFYTGGLWYRWGASVDGYIPITSGLKVTYKTKAGHMLIDEDATKKVLTNAISKGLSRLGFSADIFLGQFEDEKYVAVAKALSQESERMDPEQIELLTNMAVQAGVDIEKVLKYYNVKALADIPQIYYSGLMTTWGMKAETNK